ncbi:MAG: hypothetical protein EOP50_22735 [Sphingobacteriales bacterium]|nr:MAG: hypothetical protein EOP50_22735 [Sphingobacteriales bacterium]
MKTLRIALFALGLLLARGASAQNLATSIKVQAMEMGSALMKNDFDAFVPFMHPSIVAYAGGKEQMKAKMDSAYAMSKRFNVSFKRYWIGDPKKIVTYKNQLQAVLPQSTTLKMVLGEVSIESSFIVISADGGKHWWFIDTNVYHADKLKDILPDLSPELVIPPRSKPKFTQAQKQ